MSVNTSEMMDMLAKLLPVLIPIILIQFGLMIGALVSVIRRKSVAYLPKWAWILIIVFINLIGPIVYFIIGRKESEE